MKINNYFFLITTDKGEEISLSYGGNECITIQSTNDKTPGCPESISVPKYIIEAFLEMLEKGLDNET